MNIAQQSEYSKSLLDNSEFSNYDLVSTMMRNHRGGKGANLMDTAAVVLSTVSLCMGCYSLGRSAALYSLSKTYVREQVEKRLKDELDYRCSICHRIIETASDTSETTKAAMDR